MGKGALTQTSLRSLRKLDCAAPCPRRGRAREAWARRTRNARAFAHPTLYFIVDYILSLTTIALCHIVRAALLIEGRLPEAIPLAEPGLGVLRLRLATATPGGIGDPPARALRPGAEERSDPQLRRKCRRRKRGAEAKNRQGGAPRGERPFNGDAPRLMSAASVAPLGAPPPSIGWAKENQTPGAKAPRQRERLWQDQESRRTSSTESVLDCARKNKLAAALVLAFHEHLELWRLCRKPACRRGHGCRGDALACAAARWKVARAMLAPAPGGRRLTGEAAQRLLRQRLRLWSEVRGVLCEHKELLFLGMPKGPFLHVVREHPDGTKTVVKHLDLTDKQARKLARECEN